jgi:hypothetical protein
MRVCWSMERMQPGDILYEGFGELYTREGYMVKLNVWRFDSETGEVWAYAADMDGDTLIDASGEEACTIHTRFSQPLEFVPLDPEGFDRVVGACVALSGRCWALMDEKAEHKASGPAVPHFAAEVKNDWEGEGHAVRIENHFSVPPSWQGMPVVFEEPLPEPNVIVEAKKPE